MVCMAITDGEWGSVSGAGRIVLMFPVRDHAKRMKTYYRFIFERIDSN